MLKTHFVNHVAIILLINMEKVFGAVDSGSVADLHLGERHVEAFVRVLRAKLEVPGVRSYILHLHVLCILLHTIACTLTLVVGNNGVAVKRVLAPAVLRVFNREFKLFFRRLHLFPDFDHLDRDNKI